MKLTLTTECGETTCGECCAKAGAYCRKYLTNAGTGTSLVFAYMNNEDGDSLPRTTYRLPACLAEHPAPTGVECPVCDGSGYIEDCGACKGTGRRV